MNRAPNNEDSPANAAQNAGKNQPGQTQPPGVPFQRTGKGRKLPGRLPYQDIIPIGESAAPAQASNLAGRRTPPRIRRRFLSASWAAILGFGSIILVGTLLLRLPGITVSGISLAWNEAFFTATSAVTVTGLTLFSTGADLTFFGQLVVMLLLQIGGVGFVSISVLLLRLIGRRITLQTRFLVQQSVGAGEWKQAWRLILYVLGVTLFFEMIGALLLWSRWRSQMPEGQAIWLSIFHAVSSYCNAGFDLFAGTANPVLFGFGADWFTLMTMGVLIILGGFGITVVYDLWANRRWEHENRKIRLALNTRFTLVMSLILTTIGFVFMLSDSHFHAHLSQLSPGERSNVALFSMISARTAGVTLIDLGQISEATQLLILLWMFIGGAPASMAGGVSTSTVAVLLFSVLAFARGHNTSVAFHRTLPTETIAKAVAIMTVGTLLCAVVTLILSVRLEQPIFMTAFEVVSAFSNTGYSLGLTGELDVFSRYLIAFTMFWGRLGPITIVVALAQSSQPTLVRHPAEPVILG